jgi:nucleoside permease NupC
MIKTYLDDLTHSELFITMSAGFASVSGSVLGAYIALGIPPVHLITASIISGPGTIIISKIMCPEIGVPKTMVSTCSLFVLTHKGIASVDVGGSDCGNIWDAIAQGAKTGLFLATNVIAILVAMMSLVGALNK